MDDENMTASTKPEVHIAAPPEKDRTTAVGNMHRKYGEVRTLSFVRYHYIDPRYCTPL